MKCIDASKSNYCRSRALCFNYLLFGAAHETAHLLVAYLTGLSSGIRNDGYFPFLYRTLLGRECVFADLQNNKYYQPWKVDAVRHAGWIFSVALAILLHSFIIYRTRNKIQTRHNHSRMHQSCVKDFLIAAYITALEAISTDLLGWTALLLPGTSNAGPGDSILFCGNFGIILLHHAWLSREGETLAMDILQKMVNVTMMRGAQSGGVITFIPGGRKSNEEMVGIRSRVVNKKRTDLSKLIREKVNRDVFSCPQKKSCYSSNGVTDDEYFIPAFCGHTRFATSSKATFEGTHPQRWTPPSCRRVYDFSILTNESNLQSCRPRRIFVENYITHNGDFDFYSINGKSYDLEMVQKWLVIVTGEAMPAVVDSCAVAGVVDLLRTQGCFGLSARYAICFGMNSSRMEDDEETAYFPPYSHFEKVGMIFEEAFEEILRSSSFEVISRCQDNRRSFASTVMAKLEAQYDVLVAPLSQYLTDQEEGGSLFHFVVTTVDAFFDNDLLNTTKIFMENAKGSFGLCVTSSLDTKRQLCFAARGQTISIAFYPKTGLICYGSEQAAVKAGIDVCLPGELTEDSTSKGYMDTNNDALRLDLDDLGGEICLLDWGHRRFKTPALSKPNRDIVQHAVMKDRVRVYLLQESKATKQNSVFNHRLTSITNNRFIKPLQEESDDLVLSDIQDIPKICGAIQDDWRSDKEAITLNRLTAWNLSRCLRQRLEAHIAGTVDSHATDILLTGCEVSLWLAEQFASDLQKAFPKLRIQAVSSNKLLGLFGQEIAVPSLGFPYSSHTQKLDDTIVIIVSHSGGTFAPLACSSLFQSTTQNLFVVTSEWDTQVGKQLRNLASDDSDSHLAPVINSRIFSTEVGIRPAEPCSVSVAATHQLLTNIFVYASAYILSDHRFRRVTGAVITEQDLQILERCNQRNIEALTNIVGVDSSGEKLSEYGDESETEKQLREAGNLWANHILESARAYIMTILYILITVISGYPLMYAIAYGAGYDISDKKDFVVYLIRAMDAAIYIWLPQINTIILRLVQRRNLLHRMVGRTVVIGDIPWVAQSAEAFLSKIFAVSYSIAGLNVLSGNPADHLVHRHTHRVVRGTLLICGRPDGRISALATAESAVCLSVNQASSIQSLGGTCESITIGHNPFKLPLSANGIFLPRNRPLFLCERMLTETDVKEGYLSRKNKASASRGETPDNTSLTHKIRKTFGKAYTACTKFVNHRSLGEMLDASRHSISTSIKASVGISIDSSLKGQRLVKLRSSTALLGAYMNFEKKSDEKPPEDEAIDELASVEDVVERAIKERKWSDKARNLFSTLDRDGNGLVSKDEFVGGYRRWKPHLPSELLVEIFEECDEDGTGELDFDEYLKVLRRPEMENDIILPTTNYDSRGMVRVKATREKYFGEAARKINAGKGKKTFDFMLARSQHFSQELYENRIASLQRFVSMTVMFHQMGSRVEKFFECISFGLLGYRMDRTHSIMRIATTASPVSGADVRQRMHTLQLLKKVRHSIHVISVTWLNYKKRKETRRVQALELEVSSKRLLLKTHDIVDEGDNETKMPVC